MKTSEFKEDGPILKTATVGEVMDVLAKLDRELQVYQTDDSNFTGCESRWNISGIAVSNRQVVFETEGEV